MKATELRIGNWVEIQGIQLSQVVGQVTRINGKKIGRNLQPIPLTKEWLERFNWNPPKDIAVSFSLTTDEIHFVVGNYYKKIEHVHQLQNLYFAITGEELNQTKEDE